MLPVSPPAFSATEVFRECCDGIRDAQRKAQFLAAEASVNKADAKFLFAGATGALSRLAPGDFVAAGLNSKDMGWLYDARFVGSKGKARDYYDRIRVAGVDGRCALCAIREASTLDHHLPKSVYAALAVSPYNLLPACWECNHTKAAGTASTIHPYFDDLAGEVWLAASVVEVTPCVIEYSIQAPASWSPNLRRRAQEHFDAFDLATLYSHQAGRQVSGIRGLLRMLHMQAGRGAVRAHLDESAASWADVEPNSWEAALYRGLAASDWFCDGGFEV